MSLRVHLKALLKKNWILIKRSCCCTILEIIIPTLLVMALFAIRRAVSTEDLPIRSFVLNAKELSPSLNTPIMERTDVYKKLEEIHMKNCFSTVRGGYVALAPDNEITRELAKNFQALKFPIKWFSSNDEINRHTLESDYGISSDWPYLCLAVVVENQSSGDYKYHLRFNTSTLNKEIYDTNNDRSVPLRREYRNGLDGFIDTGFLTVQNWIDNIILKKESKDPQASIQPKIESVMVDAYYKDDFPIYMQGALNVYIVLPMILVYLRVIYRILYEKEKKIREGMKMMGMNNSSFYLSWILTYLMIMTAISIIETILLKRAVLKYSNALIVWLWMWLFLIALLFQALFITVFFTRTKNGLIGGFVYFMLLYFVISVIGSERVEPGVKAAVSLSSHAAMSLGGDTFLLFEAQQTGVTFSNINLMVENYKIGTCLGMMLFNIIFYLVLFLYLDQVFPNEFGKKRHPLFIFSFLWSPGRGNSKRYHPPPDENDSNVVKMEPNLSEVVEEVGQALKSLEKENKCVSIKNLMKTYPSGKKAVNNLSLSMYNNQIFVLLGHNGAGKTTTISMLTGLLSITSGTAQIMGNDVETEMEKIRTILGVCPQHDILFDDLTVKEHLNLFATFKGMKSSDIPQAVSKMISDLDFTDKTNYKSKNLSGGQKRKLSLGIAFIGSSKFILLDEPTSGMDTSARRHVWELLKNYKQDRIVLLTTHFMDEADFLGDRIAIMGDGKLRCCGSSVFLKNKFGVGYNLIIVKKTTEANPEINRLIMSLIPEAKVLSDVSAEISFQLPISTVPKFKLLFETLDSRLNSLRIMSYGISITTLEEVFLKIAEGNSLAKHNFNKEESMKMNAKDKVDDFDLGSVRINSWVQIFLIHFRALCIKKFQYFKRDLKGLACEILMPIIMILIGLSLMTISFIKNSSALEISPKMYSTPIDVPYAMPYRINGGMMSSIVSRFDSEMKLSMINFPNKVDWTKDEWDIQVYNEKTEKTLGTYYFEYLENNDYVYTTLVNTTSPESCVLFVNQMNQAIIRVASGNPSLKITLVDEPFLLTKSAQQAENVADGFIGSMIFSIGLSFVPASLIVFIIKERQTKVKHQQVVCGVSIFAYWASNYFVDLLKYLIPAIFSSIMCKAYNMQALIEDDNWGVCWLLFIFYGFCTIPFTYLMSFLFKDPGSGQLVTFFFNLVVGGIVDIVIWILRIIESSRSIAKSLHYVLRIFPSFTFGYGILNISNRNTYAKREGYMKKKAAFDLDIAGWDVLYLVIFSFVYFVLIFIVEKLLIMPTFLQLFTKEKNIPYIKKNYDPDVQNEIDSMEKAPADEFSIKVQNLRKVFMLGLKSHKIAVDRISFGLKNGECFGLLGVNGAGKTTTFGMLCGEHPPSSGHAYIMGHDLAVDLSSARKYIGYCPQFDALLDNLTSKEHLYLYAAIKGIPYERRRDLVEKKLDEMDLRKYENVLAGTYSGGNKRKLSVAIAMLGNPPIVFLDEPSTGMDPHARRFMWDVISRISSLRKQSTIILTTHSMEEAEALSTRMGIMVSGELKCLGSVQHLKSKFGKGYEVEIKTVIPPNSEIDDAIKLMGLQKGSKIRTSDLGGLLDRLNSASLINEIKENGSGSSLYVELNKPYGMNVDLLAEFFLINRYGNRIKKFISENLGEFTLIEQFGAFFRFKLNASVSIGSLFGKFEDSKTILNISQYSIKQTTIEQIFNMFATGQVNNDSTIAKNDAVRTAKVHSEISNNKRNLAVQDI